VLTADVALVGTVLPPVVKHAATVELQGKPSLSVTFVGKPPEIAGFLCGLDIHIPEK
jgi:hypothetical protein